MANISKFQRLLAPDGEELSARAKLMLKGTKDAFEDKLEDLYRRKEVIEHRIEEMEELLPYVLGAEFDPEEWVDEIVRLELMLEEIEHEICIVQKLYREYFGDDVISTTTSSTTAGGSTSSSSTTMNPSSTTSSTSMHSTTTSSTTNLSSTSSTTSRSSSTTTSSTSFNPNSTTSSSSTMNPSSTTSSTSNNQNTTTSSTSFNPNSTTTSSTSMNGSSTSSSTTINGSTTSTTSLFPDPQNTTTSSTSNMHCSDDTVFNAVLNGAKEVPAVNTNATGNAALKYNRTTKEMTLVVNYTGLVPISAHIHKGAEGTDGFIVFPLDHTTNPMHYVSPPLTVAQLADLKAGLYYVNIHTTAYPDGEIRGQLIE